MKNKVIAVIPAYNEAERIGPVVMKCKEYVDEVIVVNDCSKDNTTAAATEAGADVMDLIINMGAGFATRMGCDAALDDGTDVIITIDADGQHDPAEIPNALGHLLKNNLDVVFGCRLRNSDMPIIKRIGNFGLSLIASVLFGVKVADSQTGFHAFTAEAYKKLRWQSDRYGVVSEFIYNVSKARLRYGEIVIKTIYNDKIGGMRKRDAVKSVVDMILWRMKR